MAEGAISFILSTIAPIVRNEFNLLQGVRDEIKFIHNEFESMNALMEKAGDMEDTDLQFDAWVKQVLDTAYDAGDVLEQFVFRLQHRHGGGFSGFLSRSSTFMKTIFVRRRIASEIQRIKLQVEAVSQRKQRYTLNDVQASSSSNTNRKKYDIRRDALLLRENEIVGITGPKTELINWLVDEKIHKKRVLSVCGMGGLGKTTLVKKIYDDAQLVKHFEAHAWITVSKSFQTKELLKEIIKKLYSEIKKDVPVEVEEKDTTDLVTCISNFLQPKRYVIVLDDIWDEDSWNALKYAFPSNNCGSRVIITTTDTSLSSFASNESNRKIHNLLPLSVDESRTLFCQKVFQSDSCPSILEETTIAILKKCKGLPLAIVAIGGLLSTKGQTIDEWNKISRGLAAELRKDGKLANLDTVLTLSYFDLPWYLKLCFLYLSVFPEDYSINHWRLIRLWIAEGFVLPTNSELTEEEVAGSYLTELTNRSLIQIKTVGLHGRAKEYHIHDIWRELIISRSSKHDLVSIYGAQQNNFTQRVRRLAIHNKTGNWQEFKCRATHIRSLLMFGSIKKESTSSIVDSLGDGAKLLKVLDMRKQGLPTFPRKIGQLLHLKYLSLRGNRGLKEIPKSIGNLQMLETLDLKWTGVRKLPNEILKLRRLQHFLVGYRLNGFKALKGMEKLLCLETLYTIDLKYKSNNDDILRSISKLTRLRKVGIMGLKSGDANELCSTVEKLTELRSLYISAETSMDLERLSSPPKFLKTLGVRGYIKKLPEWIASLHYLTKLKLRGCQLKEDSLQQLQELPNLTYLDLNYKAYSGEELCFKAGTSKQLVTLDLYELKGMKHVSIMEGAMPRLKKLIIVLCELMEEIPSGIETLPSLSLLEFFFMSESFNSKLKQDLKKGNASKFAHIPDMWRELIISRSSKHDLVSIYDAQQNNSTQRVRRLAIHNETGNWQEFKCRATHIRSLLMFGSVDLESMSSIVDSLGDGAKLLKILDMRKQGLQTFPRKIGQLLHLKYLSLRGNDEIKEIPKSIGDLQMLETLDLKKTGVRKLPNEILKLNRLRHLLVGDRYDGFIALKGMEKLLCLEKLYTIELKYERNNDDILRSISKLTRLRKVRIIGLKSGDTKELCSTIDKLTELRSLHISAETSIDLERLSSPPKFLKTLGVSVKMEKLPKWIASLHYLTKLILFDCQLKEDPLLQLQDLPNLTYLRLGFRSYSGEELCFKAGTFKQLVMLDLFNLDELKHVSVMEGVTGLFFAPENSPRDGTNRGLIAARLAQSNQHSRTLVFYSQHSCIRSQTQPVSDTKQGWFM